MEGGALVNVAILNNSTLLAGNGDLLDVQDASTAAVTVAKSTLNGNISISDRGTADLTFDQGRMNGDVLVDGSATATVTLDNLSQLTGPLDNVDSVTVNSISNWTLTGTHTGAPFFGVPPSGKKVTINGTAILRFKDGKIVEHWGGPHCPRGIGIL